MAISGTHISCGYSGSRGGSHGQVSLLGRRVWSQTMATAGTTTNAAPAITAEEGEPIFSLYSSSDIYFAVAVAPDAAAGARSFLPAATAVDVFAQPGDKVAWITA